jgi:hypothetical protein
LAGGFFGMGAVSLNRPAMIDHPMTGIPRPEVTANPVPCTPSAGRHRRAERPPDCLQLNVMCILGHSRRPICG